MIKTMTQFNELLVSLNGFSFNNKPLHAALAAMLEVIDLRLRRMEDHVGIPVPDDLSRLREFEGRRESRELGTKYKEDIHDQP